MKKIIFEKFDFSPNEKYGNMKEDKITHLKWKYWEFKIYQRKLNKKVFFEIITYYPFDIFIDCHKKYKTKKEAEKNIENGIFEFITEIFTNK